MRGNAQAGEGEGAAYSPIIDERVRIGFEEVCDGQVPGGLLAMQRAIVPLVGHGSGLLRVCSA